MRILAIILFLSITNCLNAQVYLGLNSAFELPTNNYNEVDNGLGLEILLGYSYKQRVDVNISTANRWMNSFIENYKISSFELSTNYYFINRAISPFIGVSGGYYIKSFGLLNDEKYFEKGLGIKPRIGCLFDTNILKGLKINTQFYYNKIYTEHQINLFGFNLGLLYFVERK
jgi:hypothetical protein